MSDPIRAPDPIHSVLLAVSDVLCWLLGYRRRTRVVKAYFHYGPPRPITKSEDDDAAA